MTNKDLADLIFPNINKTIEDYDLTIDNFDYSQEGLIGNKSQKHHKQDKTIDIPGSIIKRLDRKKFNQTYKRFIRFTS